MSDSFVHMISLIFKPCYPDDIVSTQDAVRAEDKETS